VWQEKRQDEDLFGINHFDVIAPVKDNRPVAEQDVDLLRVSDLYQKIEAPSYQLDVPHKNQLKIKKWLQAQKHFKE
jgi:heptosyltransferase III